MRARRRAFALIVVLLAVGAVFALALRSAVVARTTVIEATAMTERSAALRGGRSAVVLALRGLAATESEEVDAVTRAAQGGGLTGFGGSSVGDGEDEGTRPEFPPGLEDLLELLGQVEEEAEEKVAERDARFARAASAEGLGSSGITSRQTVDALGLPSGSVDVELDGRVYRVTLRDGASALDANSADERTLRAYFGALGLDDRTSRRLADQWLDWVDEDSVSRTYGAEQRAYAREGVSARNGPIQAIEELRVLPAMTVSLFDRVREDWVVAASNRVHAGSASFAVLASVEGSSEDLARAIITAREEAPLTAETLESLYPPVMRETLSERFTLESSGLVRARVDVLDRTSGAVRTRLEGAALLTKRGVEAVELRVLE